MPVDQKLEVELSNQITLLEQLQTRVGEAIGRAKKNLGRVREGQSREQLFPPKK